MARMEVKRGERLFVAAKNKKAEAVFKRAIKYDPRNATAHGCLASIHTENGDNQKACEHYRNALKYSPDNLNYALGLGDCLLNLAMTSFNRHQLLVAAEKAYRHARSLDSQNYMAALKLGICYRHMEAYDSAIKTLQEAKRINPVTARAHNELAEIYEAILNHDMALAEYQAALAIEPTDPIAQKGTRRLDIQLTQRTENRMN